MTFGKEMILKKSILYRFFFFCSRSRSFSPGGGRGGGGDRGGRGGGGGREGYGGGGAGPSRRRSHRFVKINFLLINLFQKHLFLHHRAVERSENPGVPVVIRWA